MANYLLSLQRIDSIYLLNLRIWICLLKLGNNLAFKLSANLLENFIAINAYVCSH